MNPWEQYAAQFEGKQKQDSFRTGGGTGGFGSNAAGTAKPPAQPKRQSEGFLDKLGNVAGQTGRLVSGVVGAGANFVKNTAVDIAQDAISTGRTYYESIVVPEKLRQYDYDSRVINDKQDRVIKAYSEGRLTKADYKQQLAEIAASRKELMDSNKQYLDGPSAGQRIEDIASTVFTVASLGSLTAAKAGAKTVGSKALGQIDNTLTNLVQRVPVARSLIARNMAQNASIATADSLVKAISLEGKKVAAGLLLKRPLFYQANVADAREAYSSLISGDYGEAIKNSAWLGIQLLDGGPLGAMSKGYKWLAGNVKELSYGTGSAIDAISRRIGDNNPTQIADYLASLKGADKKLAEDTFKVLQHTQQKLYPNDPDGWADQFLTYTGKELGSLKPEEIVQRAILHRTADEVGQAEIQKLVKAGKLDPEDAKGYTPVRWLREQRNEAAKIMGDPKGSFVENYEKLKLWMDEKGLSNNEDFVALLESKISRTTSRRSAARMIQAMDASKLPLKGISKAADKKLAKLGYVYAKPLGGRKVPFVKDAGDLPRLVTSAVDGTTDLFDPAIAPQPVFAAAKNLLNKFGLSPEATARAGQVKLTESIANQLTEAGVAKSIRVKGDDDFLYGAKGIMTTLQQYVENKRPSTLGRVITAGAADKSAVTDIRQLTSDEIIEAMRGVKVKITRSQAKDIQKAIIRGYLDVPMSLRGLGDKIVDNLYRTGPLQRSYSRVQSALRYTYNPFFRIQESVETGLLSGLQGGNRAKNLVAHNGIWKKSRAELDDIARQLDEAKIFSSSLYGEAAQDQVFGRISANITRGQKRDLAGLAADIARKKNTTVEQLLKDSPDEVADALRVIVQYPREGLLASPLARTLNLAFFPIRYNAKVTTLAAQVLAKQPPYLQKAALHSLFEMSDWLKSDEGIAWQGEYADAIQVFKWLTPIGSVESTLNMLNGVDSWGEMGALGGLPLGVFTQILDSQGIIDLNTPYIDKKTGNVLPKYIPETVKARAGTALVDLLGSTFTYPGRTLGLPGKGALLRDAVRNFIATNPSDFNIQDESANLTPLQRNMIRVLQGDTSDEAIEAVYNSAINGQGFTLPPYNIEDLFPQTMLQIPQKPKKQTSTRGSRPKPVATPIQRS